MSDQDTQLVPVQGDATLARAYVESHPRKLDLVWCEQCWEYELLPERKSIGHAIKGRMREPEDENERYLLKRIAMESAGLTPLHEKPDYTQSMDKKAHLDILARASEERWPIPKVNRGEVTDLLMQAVKHHKRFSTRLRAAKALIAADVLNEKQEARREKYGRIDANLATERLEGDIGPVEIRMIGIREKEEPAEEEPKELT